MGFRTLVMEYAPTADTVGNDYAIVDTAEGLKALVEELRAAGRFALRVLPDAPVGDARRHRRAVVFDRPSPRALRAARGGGRAAEDLFGAASTAALDGGLDADEALAALKPVLEDASIGKIGHDLKFDAIVLARHGVALGGLETDIMLASYLLDATRSSHPLEDLALEHAGYKALREEDLCGRGAKAVSFRAIPRDTALNYAGERADLALQLDPVLLGADPPGSAGAALPRPRDAAHPGARRRGAGGDPHRRAGALGAVAARRAGAGDAQRADLRDGRRGVQHQLAAAAVATFSSTSCSCRPSSATSRRRPRRPRSKCSRSWRSRTTCRG